MLARGEEVGKGEDEAEAEVDMLPQKVGNMTPASDPARSQETRHVDSMVCWQTR